MAVCFHTQTISDVQKNGYKPEGTLCVYSYTLVWYDVIWHYILWLGENILNCLILFICATCRLICPLLIIASLGSWSVWIVLQRVTSDWVQSWWVIVNILWKLYSQIKVICRLPFLFSSGIFNFLFKGIMELNQYFSNQIKLYIFSPLVFLHINSTNIHRIPTWPWILHAEQCASKST